MIHLTYKQKWKAATKLWNLLNRGKKIYIQLIQTPTTHSYHQMILFLLFSSIPLWTRENKIKLSAFSHIVLLLKKLHVHKNCKKWPYFNHHHLCVELQEKFHSFLSVFARLLFRDSSMGPHTHILQTYFKLDSIFFSVLRKFCDLFYNLPVYVSLWKLIVAQVISLCYRTFSIVRITIKSNIPVIVRQLRNCKEINWKVQTLGSERRSEMFSFVKLIIILLITKSDDLMLILDCFSF